MSATKPRGGFRPGAGRPRKQRRIISLRLEQPLFDLLVRMASQQHLPLATLMVRELRRRARKFKTDDVVIDV